MSNGKEIKRELSDIMSFVEEAEKLSLTNVDLKEKIKTLEEKLTKVEANLEETVKLLKEADKKVEKFETKFNGIITILKGE